VSQPWNSLQDLEPPLGSKRRVLERIEDRRAAPHRGGALTWLLPVATLGAAALWLLWPAERGAELASRQARADSTAPIATPNPAPSAPPAPPAIELHAGDTMKLTLSAAAVSVTGPATVRATSDDALVLDAGGAHIDGVATVRSPMCEARVSGRAEVTVTDARMQVRVFAGTAEVTSVASRSSCTVLHAVPAPPAPASEPSRPRERAPRASPLRRQLDAFRAARDLAARDPAGALAAYESLRASWPDSPLREEIDAAIRLLVGRGAP